MKLDNKTFILCFAAAYITSLIYNFMVTFEQEATLFGFVSSMFLALLWIYAAVFFKSRSQSLFGFSYWLAGSVSCILFLLSKYEILQIDGLVMGSLILFFYTPMSGIFYFGWDLIWVLHVFTLLMLLVFSQKMLRLKKKAGK